MRVLHLIPTLRHGGAERQARQLLLSLASCGVDTAIFSRLDAHDTETLHRAGVAVAPSVTPHSYNPVIFRQLAGFVRCWKPTIMQTWLPQMDIVGGLVAFGFRIPLILSERADRSAYPDGVRTWLRQIIGARAAAIVANSPPGAEYWQQHAHVTVIPNGIDFAAISKAAVRPNDSRPTIVCIGRLTYQKNQVSLIEAMRQVRQRAPKAVLRLLGEGPDLPILEALIRRHGLCENVELLRYREDALSWLKAADVAVLVSHFEGTPNVALEAAVIGCPMVLSDIPAHRWAFSGKEALFVDKDDPSSIAAGIIELLGDSARRKELAAAAAARVAHFTMEATCAQYLQIYKEVEARNRRS